MGDARIVAGIAHAVDQHDVEEEATEISEQHGEGDGPWSFDFGFVDSVEEGYESAS